MALDVEPARALVWYAAYAWDAGLSDAARAAAQAKAHLGEVYTAPPAPPSPRMVGSAIRGNMD